MESHPRLRRTVPRSSGRPMISTRLPRIWFGGDYSPDQWPEETWREDMWLFTLAGVSVATLPVFSWAKLQLDETRFDFSWLDRAADLLAEHGNLGVHGDLHGAGAHPDGHQVPRRPARDDRRTQAEVRAGA